MKVKIKYEYDASYNQQRPYWAIAADGLCKSSGTSFKDAREKLLAAIAVPTDIEVPPEEEVEI